MQHESEQVPTITTEALSCLSDEKGLLLTQDAGGRKEQVPCSPARTYMKQGSDRLCSDFMYCSIQAQTWRLVVPEEQGQN